MRCPEHKKAGPCQEARCTQERLDARARERALSDGGGGMVGCVKLVNYVCRVEIRTMYSALHTI